MLKKNFLKPSLFRRLFKKQTGENASGAGKPNISSMGMISFHNTGDVIAAESCLKKAGLDVKVMGPPPEFRTGCDLVIQFPIVLNLQVTGLLSEAGIKPIEIVPVYDILLEPVSLFNTKDFGDYLMIRAANMKITVRKSDLEIVNISGGGCPDVPYLAENLISRSLYEAPQPRTLGKTLCGYALQLAYEEMVRQCPG